MAKKDKTPPQAYDKIIKENLEAILLPLAELLLGIQVQSTKKLTIKLQTTLEREPDFIREVKTPSGEQFLLHIEFQRDDENYMVYRMKEYEAILSRKYRIPIKQFVVYLGKGVSKMSSRLKEEEVFRGFELLNISSIDVEKLLSIEVPEAIILAILADYDQENSNEVLRRILTQLKNLSQNETQLKKYLIQLQELSRLRNLVEQTYKSIQEMAITYDIKKDFLYKKGVAEGVEEGIKQGKEDEKIQIIQNWLQSNAFLSGTLSYEEIASACRVSVEDVQQIYQRMIKS